MFISNLTNSKLGVNGIINLTPNEVNRYIDNNDTDVVARVLKLEAANLVSVLREDGLTKTGIPAQAVKTIGVDAGAVSDAPRSKEASKEKAVEAKEEPNKSEEVKTPTKQASRTSRAKETKAE